VNARLFILTVPSLVVLGLLFVHSLRAMKPVRAAAFWCTVATYGVLRGLALRFVVEHGLGGSFPYAIRDPLLTVIGVPAQEIAGWAIVAYLSWWLGARFSKHLFAQVAWACVFLGAIAWAIEAAAVAAGWWTWSVPVSRPEFLNVPAIAIVDWAFVGIDFLLPFAVLTAPGLKSTRFRWLALLAFPVHFGAHLFPSVVLDAAHWILVAVILWLAMRSETTDEPFARHDRLAWIGLSMVLGVAALVELIVARQPRLLLSQVPALAVVVQTLHPATGYVVGAVAGVIGTVIAVIPAAAAAVLTLGRRYRAWMPPLVIAVLGIGAYRLHIAGSEGQAELTRGLDAAIAARDHGDLDAARAQLAALVTEFPGSHVPAALLGEIDYRGERLDAARDDFLRAVRIKQDYVRGYRFLSVIDLRQGRLESASTFAERGLAIDAADPELNYLAAHASGRAFEASPKEPAQAQTLAAIAFEVGDAAGAADVLDRGIVLWPGERSFYPSRVNVALKAGDRDGARRVLAAWRLRFPQDAEAAHLARGLGVE